ncbi:DUF1642 domain-containing protein [Enterococcus raffinosus]|uniref:DUF1642 domain-containing protein n=1 Tax=Enterococcus raffinosus TaxID=71452 RepID=UPI001C963D32|nr:DUF1642 domain-containing protein [Enterococcus raffinosus]QZO07897.1 DUF1642 domain-containing protein [Enterococcus raffinosus]
MNKQEKELLISFVNSAKEDLNFSFGICQKTYHGYVQGNRLINYIEQLNESEENLASTIKLLTNLEPDDFLKELKLYGLAEEPQKVKVPEFVVEWFEENKHNLNFAIYELCEAGKVPVDLYEGLTDFERWFYLNHDIDTLIRMQDGYEVEEEPKWKIINDQKYCLTSIEAGYGNSLHWAFDSTKKKPILFDNEETALYTAYITGGTVEKV